MTIGAVRRSMDAGSPAIYTSERRVRELGREINGFPGYSTSAERANRGVRTEEEDHGSRREAIRAPRAPLLSPLPLHISQMFLFF